MDSKKLFRSENKMIGGICAGIAEYFDIDPTVIRAAYALLTLFSGIFVGVISYFVLLLIIPKTPGY